MNTLFTQVNFLIPYLESSYCLKIISLVLFRNLIFDSTLKRIKAKL